MQYTHSTNIVGGILHVIPHQRTNLYTQYYTHIYLVVWLCHGRIYKVHTHTHTLYLESKQSSKDRAIHTSIHLNIQK